MRLITGLFVLVTATGGCGTDPIETDPANAPWPCQSWTVPDGFASDPELTTYEWNAQHNLVRREKGYFRESWTYDPSGTIAVDEQQIDSWGALYIDEIHRDLADGRVVQETKVYRDGTRELGRQLTSFRYDGGRLVEMVSSGRDGSSRTVVTYPAHDTRMWTTADSTFGDSQTTFIGEPWTRQFSTKMGKPVYSVDRVLDDEGRELHREERQNDDVKPFVLIDTERGPNGAPVREQITVPQGRDSVVTYETCDR